MAWQRTGTVTVDFNNPTVVGNNVNFASSCRVGDSFIGPDGRNYEVVNVASGAVLSIQPAYQGASVTGAPYAIMPVQGYDKMLSDAFNGLNNQFGPKLAALGTTGNYDVLPVEKGGTGTAVGLGTAATRNVGTSPTNVLEFGAFGLGSAFNLPQAIDMDNGIQATNTGWARYSGATTAGRPTFGSGYGTFMQVSGVIDSGGGYGAQLAFDYIQAEAGFRAFRGGQGATPWCRIYHTGNTTRGSGGALSAASPIMRIACVATSERRDLQEETFEPAGEWGVVNSEARGVTVERINVGEYKINGSLGLALEGWRTKDPCSPDGGRTLGISESSQDEDGSIVIRLFKRRWTLAEDGEMVPGRGAPMDVPLNSWIDVRLEMPKIETPPPEPITEE
ncbi:hypothetical protein [Pseudomonas syringae]|nr:hypothetical protein [Pseudomonas azotoformans]